MQRKCIAFVMVLIKLLVMMVLMIVMVIVEATHPWNSIHLLVDKLHLLSEFENLAN